MPTFSANYFLSLYSKHCHMTANMWWACDHGSSTDMAADLSRNYMWESELTLLLLTLTCPALANSVDPDQLASEEANWSDLHCLSLNMWISIKNPDQVIWLAGN